MFLTLIRVDVLAFLTCTSTTSQSRTFDRMFNQLPGFTLAAAIVFLVFIGGPAGMAQPSSNSTSAGLPSWVKDVGSRGALKSRRIVVVNAIGDGSTNSTNAIQKAID